MSELYQLDVSALAAKLAAREVSSVEVTQALLERAKANADLGAYLALDEEVSLAQARAAHEAQGNAQWYPAACQELITLLRDDYVRLASVLNALAELE